MIFNNYEDYNKYMDKIRAENEVGLNQNYSYTVYHHSDNCIEVIPQFHSPIGGLE